MPAFSIRRAQPADADGILACLRAAFAPYREQYTPEGFADTVLSPGTIQRRLAEMVVLVALSPADEVVGTIGYQVVGGEEGHLRGMAVRPDQLGAGAAQGLLEAAESALRGLGCGRITLDTTEPLTRAMRFYERNGFRPSGAVGTFFGMRLIEYVKRLE